MKICVISTPIFPCPPIGYAGLELIAYQQAEGLAQKGHDVTLVCPEGSSTKYAKTFIFGPAGTWNEKEAFYKYHHILKDFDVIIDNTWQKYSYMLKCNNPKFPPVLGVCHAPIDTMYRTLPPNILKPCFVCISDDAKAHFEALHGREARRAYNGVDTEFYKPIGIPRTKRFLFVARFSRIKGPDIAIKACKEAGVGLDLIGDTSITNEPDYLRECLSLADGEQIRIVGPANRGECVSWMSQAHAFLHPNRNFREPYGLAPVEAQSCGLPVICWNYGAMRETVKNGETGYIVNTVEQFKEVVSFLHHAEIKQDVRQRCREWVVNNFSISHMVNRYEELATEALTNGGW